MQLALDLGKLDMQAGRAILARNARLEVFLALPAELVLHGQQQVLGIEMHGHQLRFGSEARPHRVHRSRLGGAGRHLRPEQGCRVDIRLLDVDQARLAVDAVPHVPAEGGVIQFAFSVEE